MQLLQYHGCLLLDRRAFSELNIKNILEKFITYVKLAYRMNKVGSILHG